MRTVFIQSAFLLLLSLTACAKPVYSDKVVGPDMAPEGPFGDFNQVRLTPPNDPSGKALHIQITKSPQEDVATLTRVLSETKPYLAGVTYHPFIPIVAETNADRKDYWIVGLNLTRTPDRSIYTVIRFPHGLEMEKGVVHTIEYKELSCDDLEIARLPVKAHDPANASKTYAAEFEPEAGSCEFNSLTEAYKVTPLIFKKYDQIKSFKDAPAPDWQPLEMIIN
ncbi:MAG: hypothetical protein QM645_04820 [Asticcacaulis sp.]